MKNIRIIAWRNLWLRDVRWSANGKCWTTPRKKIKTFVRKEKIFSDKNSICSFASKKLFWSPFWKNKFDKIIKIFSKIRRSIKVNRNFRNESIRIRQTLFKAPFEISTWIFALNDLKNRRKSIKIKLRKTFSSKNVLLIRRFFFFSICRSAIKFSPKRTIEFRWASIGFCNGFEYFSFSRFVEKEKKFSFSSAKRFP